MTLNLKYRISFCNRIKDYTVNEQNDFYYNNGNVVQALAAVSVLVLQVLVSQILVVVPVLVFQHLNIYFKTKFFINDTKSIEIVRKGFQFYPIILLTRWYLCEMIY